MKKALVLLAAALLAPTVAASIIVVMTAYAELKFKHEMDKLDLTKTIGEQI